MISQKMGIELYLHNLLHTKNCSQPSSGLPHINTVSYSCNCIDDFTMPFTPTEVVELPAKLTSYIDITFSYKESFSSILHLFNSLRAPPVSFS
jgi:hypothetical protein